MKHLFMLVLFTALLTDRASTQYSDAVFNLKKATDLYDERGYLKSKALSVDGKLNIAAVSGNVTYTYPIADQMLSGSRVSMMLNYCSSVSYTTYVKYDQGNMDQPYSNWNKFSQNRPAWILGVNEFAVQVLSF